MRSAATFMPAALLATRTTTTAFRQCSEAGASTRRRTGPYLSECREGLRCAALF